MATDVDRSCYGWSREDLDDQDDSREISISQMLDHGSISFGRFALEPLSWEKRSVFTHNRYQEELEKCKAPGLVAQKKAYFEEYYKRIRTMKTLQENQQTEHESNCGHNYGFSEKISEDERVVPSKSDVEEMIKTVGSGVEKATTEVSLDVDGETSLVKLDPPANFSKEEKNGENPPNSKHCQILNINSYHHEPITTSIADSELHEFIRDESKVEPRGIIPGSISQQIGVESQRVIGKTSHGDELDYVICSDRENASIEVPSSIDVETALLETDPPVNSSVDDKTGENSQNSKQFQLLDQNSCDHEPITARIEDYKQQDFISQANEMISMGKENFVRNDSFYSSSSHEVLKEKLNAEQKKEHSYAAGDFLNSELKSTATVMLTEISKDSSQKRNEKENVFIISHKQTVDRILNSRHTTSVSHESNKKMHAKITTPRPFSFATGKQAVVSIGASARHDAKNTPSSTSLPQKNTNSKMRSAHESNKKMHSKITTPCPFSFATGKQAVVSIGASARHDAKNTPSSTSLPQKNTNSKAVSSRRGIPCSQKSGKLESSGHEPRRQPLVTSGKATHLKGSSTNNVIRPSKARSVNLPTSCKVGTNVGTNSNRYIRNSEDGKQKANDETCLKEVRAQGKSTIFSVISRNQNSDNIKMARSRIKDLLSVNTKNSQLGDNSLVRTPRPEKPRWR